MGNIIIRESRIRESRNIISHARRGFFRKKYQEREYKGDDDGERNY